jgi:hypothetical protein
MIHDDLALLLNCVATDGRFHTHAIVQDEQAMRTPEPSQNGAPLLKNLTLEGFSKNELLLLPDLAKGKGGVMSPLLSTIGKQQPDTQNRPTSPEPGGKAPNTSWNRSCDGLLIRIGAVRQDGVTPLELGYFDLKSGNPSGYEGQFLSMQCFMKGYVLALLDVFFGKKCEVVRERFIVFHTDKQGKGQSLQKKRSVPEPKSACSAQNAIKIIVKNEARIHVAQYF